MMTTFQDLYDTPYTMATILIIAVLGIVLLQFPKLLENRFITWRPSDQIREMQRIEPDAAEVRYFRRHCSYLRVRLVGHRNCQARFITVRWTRANRHRLGERVHQCRFDIEVLASLQTTLLSIVAGYFLAIIVGIPVEF